MPPSPSHTIFTHKQGIISHNTAQHKTTPLKHTTNNALEVKVNSVICCMLYVFFWLTNLITLLFNIMLLLLLFLLWLFYNIIITQQIQHTTHLLFCQCAIYHIVCLQCCYCNHYNEDVFLGKLLFIRGAIFRTFLIK